ncbi:PROTEIN TRICHOME BIREFRINGENCE-LIKE 35 [Salix koriyanagi]|uniref:PROTEIN TRICHOME BIREFRINGENCE-LIKE 35 n=1 Tax=Salix koriyanagi TaxID=2511006 RepID=A0A9Q0X2H4_9ROSI|nr:PROTEIN TRICHOME BIREFRINGENCE-LIKE 35 [Salix koriyanagi]
MMQRWNRKKSHFPIVALILLGVVVCSILHNESSIQQIHEEDPSNQGPKHQQHASTVTYVVPNLGSHSNLAPVFLDRFSRCNSTSEYSGKRIRWGDSHVKKGRRKSSESCDVFAGKWVFDSESYPLYNESDCPYMSDQLACHKHGRSDLGYQHWRWQPHDCNLKRWNVTEMWEKLRGKRLMFVGDSLNRGQWISLVCLLQSVIPADKRSMSPNAPLTIFRAEENLKGPVKLSWSAEENGACEELDGLGAMELAMGAWADWVASKTDPQKKRVFFVTMSPTHLWHSDIH